MSRHLSSREKTILFLCVFMGFIYVLYSGMINPLLQRIATLKSEIVSKELKIRKEQRVLANADEVKREYLRLQEFYRQVGSNDQVMSKILSEIKEVAEELELTIPDLKPKRVRKQDYFNRFSVSLTLNSDFNDIMKFLYALQKDPHLFSVDEIQFDVGSRRRNAGMKTRLVLSKIYIFEE